MKAAKPPGRQVSNSKTPLPWRLGVLAALLLSPWSAFAAEPDAAAEARRQYNFGRTAYDAGRFTEAALAWEAAVAIKPHAATLYSAALAWERASHPERA